MADTRSRCARRAPPASARRCHARHVPHAPALFRPRRPVLLCAVQTGVGQGGTPFPSFGSPDQSEPLCSPMSPACRLPLHSDPNTRLQSASPAAATGTAGSISIARLSCTPRPPSVQHPGMGQPDSLVSDKKKAQSGRHVVHGCSTAPSTYRPTACTARRPPLAGGSIFCGAVRHERPPSADLLSAGAPYSRSAARKEGTVATPHCCRAPQPCLQLAGPSPARQGRWQNAE